MIQEVIVHRLATVFKSEISNTRQGKGNGGSVAGEMQGESYHTKKKKKKERERQEPYPIGNSVVRYCNCIT